MKKYVTVVLAMPTLLKCAQEKSNPQTQWTDVRPDGHNHGSTIFLLI